MRSSMKVVVRRERRAFSADEAVRLVAERRVPAGR